MTQQPQTKPPARKIGSATRRTVRVGSTDLVTAEPLDPERKLPLVVSPNVRGVRLPEWVTDNKDWFDEKLAHHGGIIFRDFGVGVDQFEEFMKAVSGELLSDPARYDLKGPKAQVYITTQYPPAHEIYLHNETWWQYAWPMKIFFSCQIKPAVGGATTIADGRRVLDRLDAAIVDRFADGMLHVRNFGPQVGLRPWQEVFGTEDTSEVEEFCAGYEIECHWREDGTFLQTRHLRPALATHPTTGETVWFNHGAHYHLSTNITPDMAAAVEELGFDDIPTNTYYPDASPIEEEVMRAIRDAYDQEKITYPWQPGNVMVLDNMLSIHGRQPYEGDRKVLAGLSEPCTWSEL